MLFTPFHNQKDTQIYDIATEQRSVHGALKAAGRTSGSLMPPTGYSIRFYTQMQEVPKPGFKSLFSLKSDFAILLTREEQIQRFCKIKDQMTWMCC